MKIPSLILILAISVYSQEHILITEFVVTPTAAEFIEIYNNTDQPVDLSDYYITDATFSGNNTYYYNIVTGGNIGGGSFDDFHARFPDGSSISAGEFQTIALNGAGFTSTYGKQPTYELFETNPLIPDMREALPGTINNQGTLTNAGEFIVIYSWDGQTDLVRDIDYIVWGDKAEGVDKSGVTIDGPDPDLNTSSYLADTPVAQQTSLSSGQPHQSGESAQRLNLIEAGEIQSGGNGITNHNETSEDLAVSFQAGIPNPGTGPSINNAPQITNVTITPQFPQTGDRVTISADVTDDGNINSVGLFFAINEFPFDSTAMTNVGGNTFHAVVDSQETGTKVDYFIKAIDDSGLIAQTDTFFYVVAAADTITRISEIQTNGSLLGKQVTIQGVVVIGSGVIATEWTDVYVQDNSGRGINVYRSGIPADENFVRGNRVQVRGTVYEFNGITEIIDYTAQVLSQNQPVPEALYLSTQAATNLTYEGTRIKVTGIITDKYVAGTGTNILVNDGSGAINIRVWDSSALDLAAFNTGDTVSVSGVLDIYVNPQQEYEPQLLLTYQDDIFKTNLTTDADGSGIVTVLPDSVGINEFLSLNFTFTGNSPDTVTFISIAIPDEWNWSGQITDLSFSGIPFDEVDIQVDGKNLNFRQLNFTDQASGTFTVSNLMSPETDTVSVFVIRSAGTGGTLTPVANSPSVLVGKGTSKTIVSIAEIQNNIEIWNGKEVTISGVVTIGSGILITSRTEAYVQDASGMGIQVFSFDTPDTYLKRGNRVVISGIIEDFEDSNGDFTTEITDYTLTVLQINAALPDPTAVSTGQATNVSLEGAFVKVNGTIIDKFSAGGGTNIVLDDGSGEVTLRIWDTANLDLSEFNTGDGISTRGVISQFRGSGQVLIGYQDDLSFAEISSVPVTLRVPPRPFVPDQGEQLSIIYSAGLESAHVILRIYDLGGRLITTLLDEQGRSYEQRFDWDGTDKLNEQVPVGVYILHMEVVDESTGKRKEKIAPVVIGTVISR